MRSFKITLAYDGSHYAGWQFQPGQVTLQDTFEQALRRITGENIRITASGRTDAGVHALGQVVSFQCDTHLTNEILHRALNAELPHDMAVLDVAEAAADFHAIRCARRKRYRYQLDDGPIRDVFDRHYSWHYRQRLDADAMHRAAQALLGTHDFCSFETSGSPRETTVRTIFEIRVARGQAPASHRLAVEVEADGFLYNMVRAIVGTLVEVGRGEQPEDWPSQVLAARDRQQAGQTAPAHGLILLGVQYD